MFFGGFPGFGGMSSEEDSQAQKKEVNTTQYYEILGVQKTATTEQIRKSFRKKALKQHPDKGGDPQKFKKLSNAYQVLTNPEKRQLYDDYGQQGVQNGGPTGGAGGFDIFSSFFGGGKRKPSGPRKGKPRLVELQVTLKQVFHGIMKKVPIKRYRNCQQCDGKGGQNVKQCTKCKGMGKVDKLIQVRPGMYAQTSADCEQCKGKGQIMKEEDRCKKCKGQKILSTEKVLQVSVQPGCPDQHDYIFTGQSDQYPGIIAGDVYVRIKIKKHKLFHRRGADLVIHKNISLLQALTGVTIQIDHLDDKKYVIATAPGEIITNKQHKTSKGLGLPFYKDPMSHGHLHIQFTVQFPKKNEINTDKIQKLKKCFLGMDIQSNVKKNSKKKVMEQYNEEDLNTSPQGGKQRSYQGGGFHGGQGTKVQCAQQ